MSQSKNIQLWKEKAEVDYIPLFIPLWLAVNTWMRNECHPETRDRRMIERVKQGGNDLSDRFVALFGGQTSDSTLFKGNLAELHHALENAKMPYHSTRVKTKDPVGFKNAVLDWNSGGGDPELGNIIRKPKQRNRMQLSEDVAVDSDSGRVFSVYIETIYQIRCTLFHGSLIPTEANARLLKHAHSTLTMLMKHIK